MSITFNEAKMIFHLKTRNTSYAMQVYKKGYLAHLYWGAKVRSSDLAFALGLKDLPWTTHTDQADKTFSLDTLRQEYPAYGNTDTRQPAYQITLENGSTVSDLRYKSHKIIMGKPKLDGLPSTYVENEDEAQTLEIELYDELCGLKVILSYTVYEELNAITRAVKFINEGNEKIKLNRVLSMCVDFKESDFEMLQLSGAWTKERHIKKRTLMQGIQSISSATGASGHIHNPFLALMKSGAGEYNGEVYGFSFVYSGNFLAQVEVNQFGNTRVAVGINPFDFSWLLDKNETFQTPEVVMVFSSDGLNSMSQTYHKLYRTRLCKGLYRDSVRPILINNWEATYFDFNEEKLLNIARVGKELGMELFVLDDGWFGKRNSDNCSLGDWFVNKEKLENGLEGVAENINELGMKFGLWFEPEMVSPDSDLYRANPDWCLHVQNRTRSEARNQLILDFSREEVCNAVIKMLSDILSKVPVEYVKWDMNRSMSEIGSGILPAERQKETAHRYMLGLYRVMDIITTSFPNVLFEGCAGGGGRFDPGILHYMPQIWTSDDSDAIERLFIQYGTSIVYPVSTMGAHVSAVPNHQVHRNTPLKTRGDVAMSGNFGYELDLTTLDNAEKEIIKKQVEMYKDIRSLVLFGELFRLISPFEGNESAWMYVSEDKSEAFVTYCNILATPFPPIRTIRLKGLDADADYTVIGEEVIYGGDVLMNIGIDVPELRGDYQSAIWRLKKV